MIFACFTEDESEDVVSTGVVSSELGPSSIAVVGEGVVSYRLELSSMMVVGEGVVLLRLDPSSMTMVGEGVVPFRPDASSKAMAGEGGKASLSPGWTAGRALPIVPSSAPTSSVDPKPSCPDAFNPQLDIMGGHEMQKP